MTYTNRLGQECQEESRFCRRIVPELNSFGLTFVRKQGCLKMLAGHSRQQSIGSCRHWKPLTLLLSP